MPPPDAYSTDLYFPQMMEEKNTSEQLESVAETWVIIEIEMHQITVRILKSDWTEGATVSHKFILLYYCCHSNN